MRRVLTVLAALLFAAPAAAGDSAEVRLLAGWRDGDRHVAALEIALAPGWHTYWRVPGAAGIAPRFDWSGSTNLSDVRVEWPHPEVFESFGTRTIGYRGGVVLPIILTPERPDEPIELELAVAFGVCRDICIPAEAELAGRLAPGAAEGRGAIEAALARRAFRPAEAGVVDVTCRIAPNGRGQALKATVRLRAAPAGPQVAVIEAAARPDLWIGEATSTTAGAIVTAEAPLETGGAPVALDRSRLRVTLIDARRTVDIEGCRAPE